MCGVLGIVGPEPVSRELAFGLTALQHRGQDAAGIVTLDDRFYMKKEAGLVSGVFPRDEDADKLRGRIGIGHVRYATQGTNDVFDAQPFAVQYPFGLAMAHNGNVTNFARLRDSLNREHHRLIQTSNDVELILYTLAAQLEARDLATLTPNDIFESVSAIQSRVEGAYAVVTIIAGHGLLAFRDRNGIRPLAFGRRETGRGVSHAFASESAAFDYLGFELLRELAPGEAVLVDMKGNVQARHAPESSRTFCAFELVYFAREDSVIDGTLVASARVLVGKKLGQKMKRMGLSPDIVIDVPSAAYFAASGLAEELGAPYRRGLTRSAHIGRSFIAPTQVERERLVRQKVNPIRNVVEGKKVAVVDDSIVRGTTSKRIVALLRQAGAREIYFVSAAPPVRHRCPYGIDMATRQEIIASGRSEEEVRTLIGADALVYQTLADFREVYDGIAGCYACFSGEYPTPMPEEALSLVEAERLERRGARG
ncbi:MAG: amidophosphoribosyltransferase [Deltaproteobacteria bacterium]|nr:amidophosphoribosyltransferase [Deltaproteobacteria bacterium]